MRSPFVGYSCCHNFRADFCLAAIVIAILQWIRRFRVQKVLCSAKFILPVTGNWAYSEFLFHPFVYSCNDSWSTASCFSVTFSEESGYGNNRVYRKAIVFICMNRLLFCWMFPPVSDFRFPSFLLSYLIRSSSLLLCRGSGSVSRLISVADRGQFLNLSADFVNKRSLYTSMYHYIISIERLSRRTWLFSTVSCVLFAFSFRPLGFLLWRVPSSAWYTLIVPTVF
jgi:hypothetical protein